MYDIRVIRGINIYTHTKERKRSSNIKVLVNYINTLLVFSKIVGVIIEIYVQNYLFHTKNKRRIFEKSKVA